ncbi:MAG: aldehyde dehydrogenase family protein [Bdellovibrionota bacterium]|nr:aldehyde dehydrogenase family protein [Bdellovibrionota bacterium]
MKYTMKGNFFNGKYHEADSNSGKLVTKSSPADLDQKLWECRVSNDHLDDVLEGAKKGFETWRKLSFEERATYLQRYKEEVLKRKEQIAEAISLEIGKPYWEALVEAGAVAGKVDITINESLPRIAQKNIEGIMPKTNARINFKPIGISLVIGPFNFPCHLANGQMVSSLLSGNSVIFKPSSKACYCAQLLADCFEAAGFPEGVISMIHSDRHGTMDMVKHPDVKVIFLTGGKEAGLRILENTYKDLTKLISLELGGKNVSIIHEDTNMELALAEVLKGSFLTTGQRCTSTSLVPIHESIADDFIKRFSELADKLVIDHPIDSEKEPFMGPLVDQNAMEEYLQFMETAKKEGIKEIKPGKKLEGKRKGYYVTPSIHLAEKFDKNSVFLASEIFGPNVTFVPYKTLDEAIEIANSTEYGLAGAVFTKDEAAYEKCALNIDVGILNWNRSTVGANSKLPFGGVKNSGNYRPAAVSTVDFCVYQSAGLLVKDDEGESLDNIKGLQL